MNVANNASTLRRNAAVIALASAALVASEAHAGGFYIAEQSVRGAGRAFSGEVADTGAESLWFNPAAIGGLQGGSAAVNASEILPHATVTDAGTLIVRPGQSPAPVGGDATTKDPIHDGLVPSFQIAHSLTNKIAIGLAVSAPFNFTTQYPSTSWARYSAEESRLRTIDIQPTVAFAPVPGVSLGVGVNVEHMSATLSTAAPNLLAALPDGSQTLTGKGWDVGFSLGAQFHQGPLSLGASFKSAIKHHLSGTLLEAGLLGPLAGSNVNLPLTATFKTPWIASGGIRYALTKSVTLNASVTRYGWSEFDAIHLGSPINQANPEGYQDTWAYAVGFDAAVTPRLTLRGGVARDLSPVPADYRGAAVPDTNRWVFSGGLSYDVTKGITLNAAASYLSLSSGPINATTEAYGGTLAATPILINGTISSASVAILSGGLAVKF